MKPKFLLLTFIFFSLKIYAIDNLGQNKQEQNKANKYDYVSMALDCWMLSGLTSATGIIVNDIFQATKSSIEVNKIESNDNEQTQNTFLDKISVPVLVAIPTLYSAKKVLKDLIYKIKKKEIKKDNSSLKNSVFLIKNSIVLANVFSLINLGCGVFQFEFETKTKKLLALGYAMGLICSLKDLKDELVLEYKYRLKLIKQSNTKKII